MSELACPSALASWISSPQLHRARRSDWAVVSVTGEDATKFLHSQLTHDVQLLATGGARWTALCSAKGRVTASMLLIKHATDRIELVVMADMADALIKRLKMFVLRAKVQLAIDAGRAVWTVAGASELAAPAWTSTNLAAEQTGIAALRAGSLHRAVIVGPSAQAPDADESALEIAQKHDIESVWAWIGAAASDQHVPQMLNYESIDGISFKKGCYPGQEVVARSQFRGAIKRRTYAAKVQGCASAGDAIWNDGAGTDEAAEVGVVLQARGDAALVVLQQACAEETLAAGRLLRIERSEATAAQLTLYPLPYALRDDI